MTQPHPRKLPARMADRLIVAVDVPTIAEAERIVGDLQGTVSFFKFGLWLAFAEGMDGLLRRTIDAGNRVFLDCKMYDIGKTVEEGIARVADRGVSMVTIHGDPAIIESAVKGKRGHDVNIMAVTALTSLDDAALKAMGYAMDAQSLIRLKAKAAVDYGCDGIIASAHDNPDSIRKDAGSDRLLIATPGIRDAAEASDDHRRSADAATAIANGSDYLVVGRPILNFADRPARARALIAQMEAGAQRG